MLLLLFVCLFVCFLSTPLSLAGNSGRLTWVVMSVCCCCCLFVCLFVCFLSTQLSLAGNSGGLTWVRHGSCKSSATRFCWYVKYFCVSKQCYGSQCLGFLTCAHYICLRMRLHTRTVRTLRQSALEVDSGRKKSLAAPGTRTRVGIAPWLFSRTLYQGTRHEC